MNELERSMGGRDGVIDALLLAELTPKQQHFLGMLMDPARSKDSIATICADSAVSPRELLDLFRSASFARAHALSLSYLAEKSLDVAKDVVSKSIDQHIECPECRGARMVDGKNCPKCKGKGTIFRESDVDRQKIALEAAGILKKGGGVNIAVQQNNSVSSAPAVFSKLVKQSDDIAYDVKPEDIIDAEVSHGT